MTANFPRGSVEHTEQCIDSILQRGAEVLYEHYLMEKLPGHATENNVAVVQIITDAETKFARKTQPIRGDSQPCKITKDNLAIKCSQIRRMPISAKLQPHHSQTPNNKAPIRKKFSSVSNRLINLSQPKKQETASTQLIRLETPVLDERAINQLHTEEGMRKRKQEQIAQSQIERQREKGLQKQHDQRLKMLTHQFEEIEKKHHRYTYDFEGKILNCGPVNAKTQLFSRSLYPEIRVKFDEDGRYKEAAKPHKKQRQPAISQRNPTSKSETFNSVALNSVHASKLTKPLRGNYLGSDFLRNQTFNNNNKRQMSNMNLIEICEGSKLTEVDNHVVIASERPEPVTRNQFIEAISKIRFKSFFENNQQGIEIELDNDRLHSPDQDSSRKMGSKVGTTQLPSSMSGRTKRYTLRQKDISIPVTGDRKPMTATEPVRRKSESIRPKTSHKATQGRVVANEHMLELLLE